jgi:hypothetical protein
MLTVFMTGVIVLCAVLLAVYFKNYRGLPQTDFRPKVLWTRAGIYFCACLIISWVTGTMEKILANPFVTQEQLQSTAWIIWTAVCFVLIVVAYWVVWASMTVTFKRKRYLLVQTCFGIVWGVCTAQIFLTIWNFCGIFDWPLWGRWLLGYVLLSAYMGLFQDLWWDVYVIPEHDTPRSLKLKVVFSHVPNMTVCLTYLALYDNQWIFIILQTMALTGASIFLRFPPWWETIDVVAPRTTPGLFGLPHAAGYVPEEK